MAWFRTNRGVAAWLALFALACQLTLTFGHVHIGGFGGDKLSAVNFGAGKAGAGPAINATADPAVDADAPAAPPPKDRSGLAGDFCAICANISLAAALILPILAIILAPRPFPDVLRWSPAAGEPAAFDHLPFSARGPPHV